MSRSPQWGQVTLLLSYRAASGWQVLPPTAEDPPIAGQRSTQLSSLLCSSGILALRDQAGTDAITQLSDRGMEGCALGLKTNQGLTAQFVWRFGVLLAANESARALLPNLPLASARDIAAVQG